MLLLEPQRVMASHRDHPATPDRVLVERMGSGDEQSLGELYDRHGGAAYSLALVIVGERADAEEVVADAFGQAWRTAGEFDPARGSVAGWLTTITRTRALGREQNGRGAHSSAPPVRQHPARTTG
jgi:RNA polymerase sigma-70 factor (ECF subfamily)